MTNFTRNFEQGETATRKWGDRTVTTTVRSMDWVKAEMDAGRTVVAMTGVMDVTFATVREVGQATVDDAFVWFSDNPNSPADFESFEMFAVVTCPTGRWRRMTVEVVDQNEVPC